MIHDFSSIQLKSIFAFPENNLLDVWNQFEQNVLLNTLCSQIKCTSPVYILVIRIPVKVYFCKLYFAALFCIDLRKNILISVKLYAKLIVDLAY